MYHSFNVVPNQAGMKMIPLLMPWVEGILHLWWMCIYNGSFM